MSIIQQIRARSKAGPGSVEFTPSGDDEKPWVIPLKYPRPEAVARFMAFMDEAKPNMSGSETMVHNEEMAFLAINACHSIKEGDPTEDDIRFLAKESGGAFGVLAQRCFELLGLPGYSGTQGRVVKAGKRRGR